MLLLPITFLKIFCNWSIRLVYFINVLYVLNLVADCRPEIVRSNQIIINAFPMRLSSPLLPSNNTSHCPSSQPSPVFFYCLASSNKDFTSAVADIAARCLWKLLTRKPNRLCEFTTETIEVIQRLSMD